ncbi:phosphotransferase family protein [Ferrimonas sediminicola]|uniref:phosphotransferase family protein n=1 Tax=Ferrimonas sediminicola TaxID=2569538 RepID=UPI0026C22F5C
MSFPCQLLSQLTGLEAVAAIHLLQPLWGDYGGLYRITPEGGHASLVAKWIVPPPAAQGYGHKRKLRSYRVEVNWYRGFANDGDNDCRIPRFIGCGDGDAGTLMVMEDLAAAGFRPMSRSQGEAHLGALVEWLAAFHARHMGRSPTGLWETGCYWHLATRPDEWRAMPAGPLKAAAEAIDAELAAAEHQTLVHGDAKLANFLADDRGQVGAVDFQYVGRGPGVRDLVYLLGSVLDDQQLARSSFFWLDHYCQRLAHLLGEGGWSRPRLASLTREQYQLFPFAWADFERFLIGWKPGHWKLGRFSEAMTQRALAQIAQKGPSGPSAPSPPRPSQPRSSARAASRAALTTSRLV